MPIIIYSKDNGNNFYSIGQDLKNKTQQADFWLVQSKQSNKNIVMT